jgi:hypothetical protein
MLKTIFFFVTDCGKNKPKGSFAPDKFYQKIIIFVSILALSVGKRLVLLANNTQALKNARTHRLKGLFTLWRKLR